MRDRYSGGSSKNAGYLSIPNRQKLSKGPRIMNKWIHFFSDNYSQQRLLTLLIGVVLTGCGGGVAQQSSSADASSSLINTSSSLSIPSSSLGISSSSLSISSSSLSISSSSLSFSSSSLGVASSSMQSSSASLATSSANASSVSSVTGSLVVAINAGSAKEVNYEGVVYKADNFATGGTQYSTNNAIAGTQEDALFQSERYGNLTYNIPVTQATYSIVLHFVEMNQQNPGQRAFDVAIEGQPTLTNVDIYSEVGANTAYSIAIAAIAVNDGKLTIDLTSIINNATLSGFAIYSSDGGKLVEPAGGGFTSAPKTGVRTITAAGLARKFILYVPPSFNFTKATPLLLDFHGIFGSGNGQMGSSGYKAVADKEGFLVAYPDGIDQAWNVGPCCTLSRTVDDVALARAIVAQVATEAFVDTSRIYASGFSMGGGMSHYLGCHAADLFAAIAPNAFDLLEQNSPGCAPSRPIPVLMTRGTSDNVVPYNGGASNPPNGLATINFLGALGSEARWVDLNNCTATVITNNNCKIHTQCDDGVEVGLCTIQGGGHTSGNAQTGWDFLKRFSLP